MKFSIVTPSFNQGRFLEQNIRSVLAQPGVEVEHIVMDGGSCDETVEVLQRHPHLIWRSEKDGGQTHALNKGIAMATGDVIGWINSDDYYEPDIFQYVAACFEDPAVQWVIGDLSLHYDPEGRIVRERSAQITFEALACDPDIVRQQGTFFRRSFLEQAGPFDESLHLVMDFDMWVRLSRRSTPFRLDRNLAYFRLHGEQKTAGLHLLRQLEEMRTVLSRHEGGMAHFGSISLRKRIMYARVIFKWCLIGRWLA